MRKSYFTLILSVLFWFINPWLSVLVLYLQVGRPTFNSNRTTFLWFVTVTASICLYQLYLPIPYDLLTTTKHYLKMAELRDVAWAWISKDVLSYTVFNILSFFFKKSPITFYLINMSIIFGSLWFVFIKEKNEISSTWRQIALLGAILLLSIDQTEIHHYMRQTAAMLLMFVAVESKSRFRWILIVSSILWHGSVVLLLPVVFSTYFQLSIRQYVISSIIFIVISFAISNVNIYSFLSSPEALSESIFDFGFTDRFLTYFVHPRHSTYFETYKELGNSKLYFYLSIFLLTMIYAFKAKKIENIKLRFTLNIFIWLVFFRFHILAFDRISYAFELFILLFWSTEIIKVVRFGDRTIFTLIICLSIIKLHFFVWPIDMKYKGNYLYLTPTLKILAEYKNWEINLDYYAQ